ncbi:MAG: hypothetical protein PUJ92_03810 [Bacilli bacterium]|nr:hypothetical protein [Bacilli bacterium]MDY3994674.1 hypothetical protein [Candidatus Onthovivens sp.]MDY5832451.1 hypothetical protein [Candidatus Onthovivens sp.]MDY5892902.1 hypothetical protein [Candidatus Onthovivens sp.]MDY5930021.1 hypothetical protein [Candidatus Onthovivens sp.]
MKVLKKIAAPFIAIGRWIKETAWVQPLLIVGCVFAIIFSIPSITKAIQDATKETDIDWYAVKQLSLDGTAKGTSEVDKFLEDYNNAQNAWSDGKFDEAREAMSKYGSEDRFILFFVQSDCSGCEDTQEAFSYLSDNWDSLINNETDNEGKTIKYADFSYVSIIADEEVKDNDDYKKKNPFEYLYGNGNFYSFVYDAIDAGKTSNYYRFGTESSTIKTNLENIVTTDSASGSFSANFQTPMIVEFNLTETNKSQYIIANVFYKTVGDDVYERSEFLVDMWKRKGVFSDNGKE